VAVKPGDILRDRYRIDALIGRGGMGQVFAATEIDTRTRVAIKVVSRLLVDDVLMVRLHREAEAAQRIRSEYVPHVYEVSDTEDGETFLVMERLVGEPLSQRIRDNGALPWTEVRRIGEDVLHGLIDAHAAGVVHRDLKPSNVFLALKDPQVRAMVLDFGVCKMEGIDAERLTGTGESIGTVAYMAPEQIRGAARVDERADLFAFGVLVFEMLSGRLPHDGPSQMAILASKLENAPARLRDCSRVAIPEGVDHLVARALERDPARRFQSAEELLEIWRELAQEVGAFDAGTIPTPRSRSEASNPPSSYPRPDSYAPPPRVSSNPEPHPTQTSLTTHHPSLRRQPPSGSRAALYLAACGLVAGIVVVGASVMPRAPQSSSTEIGAATLPPQSSDDPATPLVSSAEIELPADPPQSQSQSETPVAPGSKPKPRAFVPRPRPPAPPPPPPQAKPAEKSNGPRITSAPRY
jgi:serine/threonine-protein kinase